MLRIAGASDRAEHRLDYAVAMGRLVLRLGASGVAGTVILNAIRPIFALARPSPRRNGIQKGPRKKLKGQFVGSA
jgi:ABC-type taurine transport system ATPase subunit